MNLNQNGKKINVQRLSYARPSKQSKEGQTSRNKTGEEGRAESSTRAQQGGRLVVGRLGSVDAAVPAVPVETLVANFGHLRVGALEGAAEDGATHTGRPVTVAGAVGHGRNVISVEDGLVTLLLLVAGVEGRHVGVRHVRIVGEIYDQRRRESARRVGAVASEESRARVEPVVDKRILAGDCRECSTVGDAAGVKAALVGGNESGTVGPVVVSVGRGVDGEDDVHMSLGLNQRMDRDVLKILTTIDDVELLVACDRRRLVGIVVERVWCIERNVLVILTNLLEDVGESRLEEIGKRGRIDLQKELVEQGGRSAHDKSGIVKASDTLLILRQRTAVRS